MDSLTVESRRALSLWWDQLDDAEISHVRRPLAEDISVDVCIVGAGYTGLWTAYWIQELAPHLSIAILEAEVAGFGASGRNGGWASALFPASMDNMADRVGPTRARAMQDAMFENFLAMQEVIQTESIDCEWAAGGTMSLIRSDAQRARAVAEVNYWQKWGYGNDYYRLLGATETDEVLKAPETLGSLFTPYCARIQPAKLVRHLARLVEKRGATIFENTKATQIARVTTTSTHSRVTAQWTVNAIEAWQSQHDARSRIPVYSLMIATEPLSPALWDSIGLANNETFADLRNLIIYGQRTADNRIAFGGRGAPYHWGSALHARFDTHQRIHSLIHQVLVELLPQLQDSAITHLWGGPLGIHRDWRPAITIDQESHVISAGGYVGDGVAATHLAGRTIAHAIAERPSHLLELPWVNHRSQRWEPEPLRWLGANLGLRAMTLADTEERLTHRPSVAAGIFRHFLGH